MVSWLERLVGSIANSGIRAWVRITGRRVARDTTRWLDSPLGTGSHIGAEFYDHLARQDNLQIRTTPDCGLLTDFGALRGSCFDPDRIRPEIRDFYEHTSSYRLEAWSDAPFLTRVFLWGLTRFVSRPMQQLNFPVSPLELAGGMTSEVLPLVDAGGNRCYTGWLRRLAGSGRVLYTGLYTIGQPGNHPDPCVKVSFPLPQGSSTVFLRPEAQPDGSFKLISAGNGWGQPGFYRMLQDGEKHWRVRYIRTLREYFHVYVDADGVLRTEHLVTFLGLTPLRLHYKMERVLARATL